MLKDLLVTLGVADAEAATTAEILGAYSTTKSFHLTNAVTAWRTAGTLYVVAHGVGLDFKFTQRGRVFGLDIGHCRFTSLSPFSWESFVKEVTSLLSYYRGLQPGDDRILKAMTLIAGRHTPRRSFLLPQKFWRVFALARKIKTDFPAYVPPAPPKFTGNAPSYPWMRHH